MVLINGQWQGGGNTETLYGAKDIAKIVSQEYTEVPISEDTSLELQFGIIGCEVLKKQIFAALQLMEQKPFTHLFTIGGGCDADVASIAYMNKKYSGCLNVIWLDAHGDLNAPAESESHLFYGMPLRALMGDCPPISELIAFPLSPNQMIHNLNDAPIYIHLDLDVLDSECFGSTPLPVKNGLSYSCLINMLKYIKRHYDLVGLGIFEYVPTVKDNEKIVELIEFGK